MLLPIFWFNPKQSTTSRRAFWVDPRQSRYLGSAFSSILESENWAGALFCNKLTEKLPAWGVLQAGVALAILWGESSKYTPLGYMHSSRASPPQPSPFGVLYRMTALRAARDVLPPTRLSLGSTMPSPSLTEHYFCSEPNTHQWPATFYINVETKPYRRKTGFSTTF